MNDFSLDAMVEWAEDFLGITGVRDMPIEEVVAFIEAKQQDIDRRRTEIYREKGFMALSDLRAMNAAMEGMIKRQRAKPRTLTLRKAMEFIRSKKGRRGHIQQQALDIYDAHYRGREFVRIPDDQEIDLIEEQLEREFPRAATQRGGGAGA